MVVFVLRGERLIFNCFSVQAAEMMFLSSIPIFSSYYSLESW
jgi:hypothetical protein